MTAEGVFIDVIGLSYRCGAVEGTVTEDFKYRYEPGAVVTFSIGELVIGHSVGKPLLTVSDLVAVSTPTFDPKLVNRARLLYSLSPAQGFEKPIIIDSTVRTVIADYAAQVDLDSDDQSIMDNALSGICAELGVLPKSVAHARNHLRREAAGFKVMRDIKIPTQDGNYVLGDVYLPLEHARRYPVLMSCTPYGKRVVYSGPNLEDAQEVVAFEEAEDYWHSTSAGIEVQMPIKGHWFGDWTTQRGFENIATFNTFTYVPHGYAMVKIDPRGVAQTPGTRGVIGELAGDFYDSVEWAAQQTWSNGKVALVGSSYGANVQWNVAQLKPKGLVCFVPYATDLDTYREAAYTGGIPSTRYLSSWYERVKQASPKWTDQFDLLDMMKANPFYNALWQMVRAQPDEIDLPCFLAASQIFMIHGRGAFEAWRALDPENTYLQLVDCNYYPWPSHEASGKILQFLDRYLKGVEYPKLEKVGIQVRLGYERWYWRRETNWPIPGTQSVKWYLRIDETLSRDEASEPERRLSYSSKVPASGKSGVSFYSAPFEDEVEFAGHFTADLNISSSTADADVVVSLWADNGKGGIVPFGADGQPQPLAKGFLRASHRKVDPSLSLPERPWHTHTLEDNAPLDAGQVVAIQVEIYPAAARMQRGWRLRLDISPSEEQPDIPGYNPPAMRVWYGEEQEDGVNTVHVGGGWTNSITCPVVPRKEGYRNLL